MTDTVRLRLVRPYATEEELIAAEGWAIDTKGMVLVGQPRLPSGTLVRFELLLEDGQRLLVAEGKVVGYTRARGDRPAGAKVRFKRFNAAGKAFVERVVASAGPPPEAGAALARPQAAASSGTPAVAPPRAEVDATERSGIRQRVSRPVTPPENRDELLERLRARARLIKIRKADGNERSA